MKTGTPVTTDGLKETLARIQIRSTLLRKVAELEKWVQKEAPSLAVNSGYTLLLDKLQGLFTALLEPSSHQSSPALLVAELSIWLEERKQNKWGSAQTAFKSLEQSILGLGFLKQTGLSPEAEPEQALPIVSQPILDSSSGFTAQIGVVTLGEGLLVTLLGVLREIFKCDEADFGLVEDSLYSLASQFRLQVDPLLQNETSSFPLAHAISYVSSFHIQILIEPLLIHAAAQVQSLKSNPAWVEFWERADIEPKDIGLGDSSSECGAEVSKVASSSSKGEGRSVETQTQTQAFSPVFRRAPASSQSSGGLFSTGPVTPSLQDKSSSKRSDIVVTSSFESYMDQMPKLQSQQSNTSELSCRDLWTGNIKDDVRNTVFKPEPPKKKKKKAPATPEALQKRRKQTKEYQTPQRKGKTSHYSQELNDAKQVLLSSPYRVVASSPSQIEKSKACCVLFAKKDQ